MNATIPRCPACGEPARNIMLEGARVRCQLRDDGSPGKVLSVAGMKHVTKVAYECGGGHLWTEEKP